MRLFHPNRSAFIICATVMMLPACGSLGSAGTQLPNGPQTPDGIHPGTYSYRIVHKFILRTGALPYGAPINVNGTLYGTTSAGGKYEGGTVYSFSPITGKATTLHNFGKGNDGSVPEVASVS